MGFGMRGVEGAAERVADLVMQRHADRAKHRAAEPGAIERFISGIGIVRCCYDFWQASGESAQPLERHQGRNRITITCIKAFDGMRHGIEAARHTHRNR